MCCNKSGRQDWNVIEAVKYLIKENVSQKNSLRWRFCFICCTCFDLQIREAVLKCIWMKLCVLSNVISIRVQKLDPFTHTHPSPPPPYPLLLFYISIVSPGLLSHDYMTIPLPLATTTNTPRDTNPSG